MGGSLMRFAPIAIFYHASSTETILDVARKSSYTTHPGIIAAEACAFLGYLIASAINLPVGEPSDVQSWLVTTSDEYYLKSGISEKSGWGYDQIKALVKAQPESDKERCWAWRE